MALSVASVGAKINAFNLIPVWQLDGARGMKALSRAERFAIVAVAAAAALFARQWMPALVAAFAIPRALRADATESGDRGAFGLFAVLIVALAVVGSLPASVRW